MDDTPKTGVFPCYENQFAIGAAGNETPSDPIADMEEYSVAFDNGVEEWHAYGEDGWIKRLMTSKSIKISVKGKRNIGDTGNDTVANIAFENGRKAEKNILWTFPSGATVLFKNAVISVGALNAAAATNVAPLEFEVQSNGKPAFAPAA
jgi:hypothetical protein